MSTPSASLLLTQNSAFIGSGAGSSLQGLGLTQAQIDNLNSYSQVDAEVDVGFEIYMQSRANEPGGGDAQGYVSNKRPRYSLSNHSASASPVNHTGSAPDPAQPAHTYALQNLLNDNLSTGAPTSQAQPPPPPNNFQNDCFAMMSTQDPEFNIATKINGDETTLYNFANSLKHYSSSKMVQAAQLIEYNLNNFRADQSYHLPPSLKPSLTQRTVPHDNLIDGIPFASLRDKLILQNDKLDVRRVMRMLLTSTTIHGEDVLNSENWEFDEKFYSDYSFLIDRHMLDTSNKWRERSGRPLLTPRAVHDEVNDLDV